MFPSIKMDDITRLKALRIEAKLVSLGLIGGSPFIVYVFKKKFGQQAQVSLCYLNNLERCRSYEHCRIKIDNQYYDPVYHSNRFFIPDPRDLTETPRFKPCASFTFEIREILEKLARGDYRGYENGMASWLREVAKKDFNITIRQ